MNMRIISPIPGVLKKLERLSSYEDVYMSDDLIYRHSLFYMSFILAQHEIKSNAFLFSIFYDLRHI